MKRTFFIIALLWIAGLAACTQRTPPKSKEQVMDEKLVERITQWEADLKEKCLQQVMERAVVIVDSTIIANARQNRDSEGNILLPQRPGKPEFNMPIDTTPIKPLILKRGDTIR